ncbi:MAG: metalloregulator ArsR/SmtB family transcription factor [Calditrichia bacterium]|nr:MAG: ArsR family transcriptional regulator [Bacteroidota bacterium]
MKQKIYELKADLLSALGHANRLRILEFLKNGEQCNCDIYPELDLEQSNLSRHMKILQEAGIVTARKKGLKVYYKVVDPRIYEIMDIVSEIVKTNLKRNLDLVSQL